MVTSSMPSPMPATNRQMTSENPVYWKAMIAEQTMYQTSDQTKIFFRPRRSATWPSNSAPTQRPAKVAKTKVPKPAAAMAPSAANGPSDCTVNSPDPTIPGAT